MSQKSYYLTTPIYYVNDIPHIGHAYTSLACDVLARFKRLDGYEVKFLTGTDEHGQKVEKSAYSRNISPQEFTDQISEKFRELTKIMNFSNDDFIRTTEERHKKTAMMFWQKLEENGYIYLDKYAGWYSVRDEAFYGEDELIGGKAPTGSDVQWHEEESYFFKLSLFQEKLLDYYDNNPDFIAPISRRNEVISFVRGGKELVKGSLRDLSISRTSFAWGVKVPNQDKHIMYVWLDALTNYISALDFATNAEESTEYKKFWPADLHMVGKDIIRFHAVYWPAFLMAADLPIPKRIFAHGWWTNEGEKISKSLGNVINPIDLVNEFGLDQVRYFLMKEVPFGNDGNYSKEMLIAKVNSDLANNIGNLVQRTLSMIYKNCEGTIRIRQDLKDEDTKLLNHLYDLIKPIREDMDKQKYHEALDKIIMASTKVNEYIDKQAPWKLKKDDEVRMEIVLSVIAETIRVIAIILQPFMPDSAGKILDLLKIKLEDRNFICLTNDFAIKDGHKIIEPSAIFPKIL